jgi:antitoxin VapB
MLPLTLTDGFVPTSLADANDLLVAFGHNLGPVNRPFRSEPWVFLVDGQPMAVAVGASIISSTVASHLGHHVQTEPCTTECRTYARGEVVELARLASSTSWANRLMLRWWKEVAAPRWTCWPVKAAISYSQNTRHGGDLYRFDGWVKGRSDCGSSGGGTWSRGRSTSDAAAGTKTIWVWRYPDHSPAASDGRHRIP